jgi:hypothetical protein
MGGMVEVWSIHIIDENIYKYLVAKPEGKKPFERRKSRREHNIKMALK